MACPIQDDCPLYGFRDEGWCDEKWSRCVFYNTWYNSKAAIEVMEADESGVIKEVRIGHYKYELG